MPVARVGAVVLAVIVVNVLVRVVGTPDIDLPELPGWLHALLKVKNVALAGLIVGVVVLGLAGEVRRRG
jgi:cytochrome b561